MKELPLNVLVAAVVVGGAMPASANRRVLPSFLLSNLITFPLTRMALA
jgi:hypothetical protein